LSLYLFNYKSVALVPKTVQSHLYNPNNSARPQLIYAFILKSRPSICVSLPEVARHHKNCFFQMTVFRQCRGWTDLPKAVKWLELADSGSVGAIIQRLAATRERFEDESAADYEDTPPVPQAILRVQGVEPSVSRDGDINCSVFR